MMRACCASTAGLISCSRFCASSMALRSVATTFFISLASFSRSAFTSAEYFM
jgi:hypothetical protein